MRQQTTKCTVKTTTKNPLNIVNVMLWMQRNAYEESTIRKVTKLLRHLQKNCNTQEPEEVKAYISKKTCSNAHKENLIEAYSCYMKSKNQEWNKPFYSRYDKLHLAPLQLERSRRRRKTVELVRHMLQERFRRTFPLRSATGKTSFSLFVNVVTVFTFH
jgi:hypothetical protein